VRCAFDGGSNLCTCPDLFPHVLGYLGVRNVVNASASAPRHDSNFALFPRWGTGVKQVRQVRTQLTIEGAIAAQQPGDCPSGIHFLLTFLFEVSRSAPSPTVHINISTEQHPCQLQV